MEGYAGMLAKQEGRAMGLRGDLARRLYGLLQGQQWSGPSQPGHVKSLRQRPFLETNDGRVRP